MSNTGAQERILRLIHRRNMDGTYMTSAQVAKAMGAMILPTANNHLKRLEQKGLIERVGRFESGKKGRPSIIWRTTNLGVEFLRPADLPSADS